MSNDLNQCNFIGRLGQDVEMKYLPSGDPIASFSIAVGWKGKDKEGTEWINIVAFSKLAEICGKYLRKGSKVFISGRFKTEKYQKDGADRYITKIVADNMQMLDAKPDGQQSQARQESEPAPTREQSRDRQAAASRQPTPAPRPAPNFSDMDDDIPF